MIRSIRCVVPLIFVAYCIVGTACAQDASQGPKTIAFVVGIEKYDEPELDKLKYVVKDARDIFNELKTSTNFDLSRSWLMVADRTAATEKAVDSQNHIISRQRWSAEEIRAEFKRFLRRVQDDDNVLFYIGGHGTATNNAGLMLTGSNYDWNDKLNDIPFSNLLEDVKRELMDLQRSKVNVAMFLNVCGAGNANNAMSVDISDTAEAARKLHDVGIGQYGLAIFPAAPRNENTFEDEKRGRSVMAHALLEALRGGAKPNEQGKITALSLFKSIEEGVNAYRRENGQQEVSLPKDDSKFAADMTVAVVEKQRGEANFLVATSLLAAAREIEPSRDRVSDTAEREAQSRLLTDLAIDQFGLSIRRNALLKPRARLRRAQARLSVGARLSSPEVQKDIEALVELNGEGLSKVERSYVDALTDPATVAHALPTLRSLRDELASGKPFHYAVLDGRDFRSEKNTKSEWQTLLDEYPGGHLAYSGKLDIRNPTPQSLVPLVDALASLTPADKVQRLVLVYDGVMANPRVGQADASQPPKQTLRLVPFGRDEIDQVARLWSGPITVILSAPFGGVLLGDAIPGKDISLLLEAREANGMTFLKENSTSDPLLDAFRQGAEDPATHPAVVAYLSSKKLNQIVGNENVVGTPIWVPEWGAPDKSAQHARAQLGLIERWGALVALGCAASPFDACDDAVTARIGRKLSEDYVDLVSAAERDVAGEGAETGGAYRTVSNNLRRISSAPETNNLGQKAAQKATARIASLVSMRASGASSKQGRVVHILLFGVEEYKSPLVADLPGTMNDLARYGKALKAALEGRSTDVRVNAPLVLKHPNDIPKALEDIRASTRPQDLTILVFSGRGDEHLGRRYLAGEAFEVGRARFSIDDLFGMNPGSQPVGARIGLDLWSIADKMRGRWFVGLYDAQFRDPVRRESDEQSLDKHVDSIRPEPLAAVASLETEAASATPLPRGSVPAKQVHIWVDGQLTASYGASLICGSGDGAIKGVQSPMAAKILRALSTRKTGTYRQQLNEWANEACGEKLKLVFQGDLDVPMFASGDGAEYVDFFRSEDVRRDLNLRAALGVTEGAEVRFSDARHRLARAAILVALARLYKDNAELLDMASEQKAWLREARRLLTGLRAEQLAGPADTPIELWPICLELLALTYDLLDDPQEAMKALRDAQPVSVLAQRNLAAQLVSLTDKARRQQAALVLQRTADTLRELSKVDANATKSVTTQLDKLIAEERKRQSGEFRIEP